jgi:TonB family protein
MTATMLSNLTIAMTQKNPSRILLAILLATASTAAFAAKSNQSPLPKKPAALLALAAQHNGLAAPNLKPWHIKATYQTYGPYGHSRQKGTFEEWWEGPNEYKFSFNRAKYHLQIVVNAKGTYVSGNDATPYPEYIVRHIFLHPVSAKLPAKGMKLHFNVEKFGSAKLDCVEEIPHGLQPTGKHVLTPTFPTYCLNPSTPMLLVYGSYGQSQVEITSVGTLEGRYIPITATIFDSGRKYLTVHLEKGESNANWPPGIFTPPHGTRLEANPYKTPAKGTKVHAGVIAGYRLGGQKPVYPFYAKDHNQKGVVVLSALIDRHGDIRSLVVDSAPSMSLANSALAAVKTWKYKPYRLNGHPVSIFTNINVVYSLSSLGQFGNGR